MTARLQLISDLLVSFNNRQIRYVHFKSNMRLEKSALGLADLDVLVDRDQAQLVSEALRELGFKQFVSPLWRNYPGIHDWLGFDSESGRIIHLHLHYQILTGARFVKQYRLDIEELVLESRREDPGTGIPVPDVNIELILFAVRECLRRTRTENVLKWVWGKKKNLITEEEYQYLRTRANLAAVQHYAEKIFFENATKVTEALMDEKSSYIVFHALRRIIFGRFAWTRRYSLFREIFLHWGGYLSQGLRKLSLPGLHFSQGKSHISLGLTVAIVGCDGSGKTTLERLLSAWLRRHIATESYYLGSGDGPLPCSLNLVKKIWRTLRPLAGKSAKQYSSGDKAIAGRPFYYFIGKAIFILRLCFNRLKSIQAANKLRNIGGIGLMVRFPQLQFPGINDGPRLQDLPTRLGKYLTRSERTMLQQVTRIGIDLLIYLDVPLETAISRRPEMAPSYLAEKLAKMQQVVWATRRMIVIDGSKPLDQVQAEACRAIWEAL
jgi:hypothetical protein